MDEAKVTKQAGLEILRKARQRTRDRVSAARWDLDIAVFAFAVLIIVMILLFQGVRIEIIAIAAASGLAMVWLAGWSRGRKLYERFYDEELTKLIQESKTADTKAIEETVDEKVRKALLELEKQL